MLLTNILLTLLQFMHNGFLATRALETCETLVHLYFKFFKKKVIFLMIRCVNIGPGRKLQQNLVTRICDA